MGRKRQCGVLVLRFMCTWLDVEVNSFTLSQFHKMLLHALDKAGTANSISPSTPRLLGLDQQRADVSSGLGPVMLITPGKTLPKSPGSAFFFIPPWDKGKETARSTFPYSLIVVMEKEERKK